MLSIYITSQLVDKILTGVIPEKIVHITSGRHQNITSEITRQPGKEGSILSGSDLTEELDKHIIFVLIQTRLIYNNARDALAPLEGNEQA